MKKVNHWINGKNVAGNDYFQTTNPATGEVLADVASGGEAEINQAVAAAKEAFPKWANLPMKERARLMRRLGDLIDQNVPEIAAMETADTGLPIHQTKNVLIPRASHNFEFFAEVCQQMNGKTYPVDDKMLNYTLVQPVGVCALVSPWNVPFMTATWKVAPCLALGNTAVLKMSELSPLTADSLGELALEADIPAGVLNVVQGYGATAGDALVRHHDVRAVSFTGGTATGRNIMKNAGLKKYSMELGGKSPVLIFEDADIERALDAALFTIFSINGERCTAGSRVFISAWRESDRGEIFREVKKAMPPSAAFTRLVHAETNQVQRCQFLFTTFNNYGFSAADLLSGQTFSINRQDLASVTGAANHNTAASGDCVTVTIVGRHRYFLLSDLQSKPT